MVELHDLARRRQVLAWPPLGKLGHAQREDAFAEPAGVDPVVNAGVGAAHDVGVGAVRIGFGLGLVEAGCPVDDVHGGAPDVRQRHGEVLRSPVAHRHHERFVVSQLEPSADVHLVAQGSGVLR